MKKVIYIALNQHIYNTNLEWFGVPVMLKNEFEVEVWSTVRWLYPKTMEPLNKAQEENIYYIDDQQSFDRLLNRVNIRSCVFLIFPGHENSKVSRCVRKSVYKAGGIYCNLYEDPSLNYIFKKNLIPNNLIQLLYLECKEKIVKYCVRKNKMIVDTTFNNVNLDLKNKDSKYINIYNKIIEKMQIFIYPILYPSTLNFLPTVATYFSFPNKLEYLSNKNVFLNSHDYDMFLSSQEDIPYSKPFVTFLDQYLCKHSDYEKRGILKVIDEEKYLNELNCFFDFIEDRYKCPVIIAAHPKAEYIGNEFNGRRIILGSTNELVKNAEFVIGHFSTAFSFVALHRKPYMIIYNDDMLKLKVWESIFGDIEKQYHVNILNLSIPDDNVLLENYLIDPYHNLFDEFLYICVKSNYKENRNSAQVIAEYIEKLTCD